MPSDYLPIFIFLAIAMTFPIVAIVAAKLIRPSAPFAEKLEAYECGIKAASDSRGRYTVRFYIVAILFVIFDVRPSSCFPGQSGIARCSGLACRRSLFSSSYWRWDTSGHTRKVLLSGYKPALLLGVVLLFSFFQRFPGGSTTPSLCDHCGPRLDCAGLQRCLNRS